MRIATYNIHKARGLDGRLRPGRIAAVLREIDADAVGLQEILAGHLEELRRRLGGHWAFAAARTIAGEPYGNAVFSRQPIERTRTLSLAIPGREPRIALQADLCLDGHPIHLFNLHLGMDRAERRRQCELLFAPGCLNAGGCHGARIVLGDLNESTRGPLTRALCRAFGSRRPRAVYPPLCPVLPLDQIHASPALVRTRLRVHRSRLALIASDHAPLVADFCIANRGAIEEQ